jgi:hypothetical protein
MTRWREKYPRMPQSFAASGVERRKPDQRVEARKEQQRRCGPARIVMHEAQDDVAHRREQEQADENGADGGARRGGGARVTRGRR